MANNLRDIPTDRATGKNTLAVRLGDRGTRLLYAALILVALLAVVGMALDLPAGPHRPAGVRGGLEAAAAGPLGRHGPRAW